MKKKRKYWIEEDGFMRVIDLEGCSLGLYKNFFCDMLFCKFRCP
jgi:hypothetical protein